MISLKKWNKKKPGDDKTFQAVATYLSDRGYTPEDEWDGNMYSEYEYETNNDLTQLAEDIKSEFPSIDVEYADGYDAEEESSVFRPDGIYISINGKEKKGATN